MLKGTMNKVKVVAIGIFTLVAVVVVLQNTQAVETKVLFFTMTMPNAALLFGALIVGFICGALASGHIVAIAKQILPKSAAENRQSPA